MANRSKLHLRKHRVPIDTPRGDGTFSFTTSDGARYIRDSKGVVRRVRNGDYREKRK